MITLDGLNLITAERLLCETALHTAGNIRWPRAPAAKVPEAVPS